VQVLKNVGKSQSPRVLVIIIMFWRWYLPPCPYSTTLARSHDRSSAHRCASQCCEKKRRYIRKSQSKLRICEWGHTVVLGLPCVEPMTQRITCSSGCISGCISLYCCCGWLAAAVAVAAAAAAAGYLPRFQRRRRRWGSTAAPAAWPAPRRAASSCRSRWACSEPCWCRSLRPQSAPSQACSKISTV
jgi:hypothetical protein